MKGARAAARGWAILSPIVGQNQSTFTLANLCSTWYSHVHMIYTAMDHWGEYFMAQEVSGTPQQGTLLRRAHELLESVGQPVSEDLLLQHLFGVSEGTAHNAIWPTLLRRTLESSSLFEQPDERQWSLVAWRSTLQSLREIDFVILDTETTGLRPGHHRVIEIAGIRMHGGEVTDSFQSLVNPGSRLPAFIVQFTGITQDMVEKAPKTHELFPDFLQFVDGAIIVGHNLGFDIGFLCYEAQLLGYDFPIDGLDTIPLARRFLPGLRRFKLDYVATHLKIPTQNRHRALGVEDATPLQVGVVARQGAAADRQRAIIVGDGTA